jgi:hypothetical protein
VLDNAGPSGSDYAVTFNITALVSALPVSTSCYDVLSRHGISKVQFETSECWTVELELCAHVS